jgi:hypothetical protein
MNPVCGDIRGRLEEYYDGELGDAAAAPVRAHLASCRECAAALGELEKLETLLRRNPAEGEPGAGFVRTVSDRARFRPATWRTYVPMSLAAAALLGLVAWQITRPATTERYGMEQAFRDVTSKDAGARARAVAWVQGQGESMDAVLLSALTEAPVEKQRAAGLFIANLGKEAADRILAKQSRLQRDWELQPIGGDMTDVELVGYAVQLARSDRTFGEAISILQKLDREAVNRAAHDEIVRHLKEMFTSGQEATIRAGFRIAEKLELVVSDVIEFLDVPELGDRAHEFLKKNSGRDFGRDKDAWRGYYKSMQM